MGSPTFYSEFFADQVNKTDPIKADPESEFLLLDPEHNGGPSLADLDPSLELSVDLQELIDRNHQLESSGVVGEDNVLFPELLPNTVGGGSEDGGTSPDTFNIVQIPEFTTDQHQPMPGAVSRSTPEVEDQADCSNPVKEEPESPGESTEQTFVIEVGGDLLATLGDLSAVSVADLCAVVSTKTETEDDIACSESAPDQQPSTSIPRRPRNQAKAPPTNKGASSSRKRKLDRDSEEYRLKRERNNVAVRKSRDKAKAKHQETESRVQILTEQNEQLQKKVDLLTKELTVLKGLFANVGAALPPEVQKYFK